MKKVCSILLFLLLTFSLFKCADSDVNNEEQNTVIINPLDAYTELNISYGDDINQVFDLYLPANRTFNTKTLIIVHGGGWTSGDKSDMAGIKDFIKVRLPNTAIINMNYRLADENNPPYPMQINDITAVVNYLKENKTNYSISDDIGFIGASAGAHLSLLWSYAFDTDANVNMVCSIVGPTNFTDSAYLDNPGEELQALLDAIGIENTTNHLELVSPYHQVTATAPPTILFYGGEDPLIPTSQGISMRDKLQELNIIHEFTLYDNEGHGWLKSNRYYRKTESFY
jgi:acetyl esterase/lipase